MKKFLLLSLISVFCVCNLNAQKTFMELVSDVAYSMGVELLENVTEEQLLGYCNDVIKKHGVKKEETPATFSLRSVQPSDHDRFVNRVRLPDLSISENTSSIKYYHIKNVKTGQYLHMVDKNSPLVTVAEEELTSNSMFYFYNRGLLGGINYEVLNRNSGGDVFYGPAKNKWGLESGYILASNSHPKFYFNVLEDGSGFYISDVEQKKFGSGGENLGDVWTCVPLTYDPETGDTLTYELTYSDEIDEYAVWVIEPFYATSLNISNASDTTWYVVRNIDNGQYLHYNGADQAMSTVVAPDTCSLFYGLSNGTFGNYAAGNDLLCAGVDSWNSTGLPFYIDYAAGTGGTEFYITEYGKKAYWTVDGNGTVGVSPTIGNNSKWQFEKIVNFKEIFGMGGNWANVMVSDLLFDCLGVLDSEKLTQTQIYTSFIGVIASMLYGAGSNFDDINQVVQIQNMLSTFGEVVQTSDKLLKEMSLFNADYIDVNELTGQMTVKGLATNTTSLIVNDMSLVAESADESYLSLAKKADQRHTNMWQFYIKGFDIEVDSLTLDVALVSDDVYSVFYNTATRMYVSAPYLNEKGEYSVTMTSDESRAGKYSTEYASNVSTGDDDIEISELVNLLDGYYGALQFQSYDVENCYLYLASPDDIALSCIVTENPDTLPGINWLYVAATSVIDEKLYNHAQDAVNTYPGFIQENFGLVTEEKGYFTSNYPLLNENSSYANIMDNDFYSAFWTSDEGNENGEAHYLQADLGEDGAVSGFLFFIKPNLNEYLNVPASITVSGSNDENGEFVVLAENIEMPNLLYDMYYFSDSINVGGTEYRYLRFTVDSVNAVKEGCSEREFTLSEFYIYPCNDAVKDAKESLDGFFDEEYLDMEIIDPAVVLMKQKAEYLLEVNKDNHSTEPTEGQYPTATYNALRDACDALDYQNQETIDTLFEALEAFINSKVEKNIPAIFIIESAWDDSAVRGKAIDASTATMQDVNPWCMYQWVKASKGDDENNPYVIAPFVGESYLNVNIDVVDGWTPSYNDSREAYNFYAYDERDGKNVYFYVQKSEDGTLVPTVSSDVLASDGCATWYLTPISEEPLDFEVTTEMVDAMAEFGKTMALAKYYYEGEQAGKFVYVGNDGLTKEGFNALYNGMIDYYEMGPLAVMEMYQNGYIGDDDVEYIMSMVENIKLHFPNFVFFNGYFRLRGQVSGKYIVSQPNGTFTLADNSDNSLNVELKSIYYTHPCADMQSVNVISYEDGRYIKAENGVLKYDNIPVDETSQDYQTAFCSLNDNFLGLYNKDEKNHYYFIDNETGVSVSYNYYNLANYKWKIEIVEELPVVISNVKFATFYCPMELQIPNGVVAYVVYGEDQANGFDYNLSTGHIVEKGTEVFHVAPIEGGIIPAGTPVLLNAVDAGTYYFKINYIPTVIGEKAKRATYNGGNEDVVNLLDGRHAATYIAERADYTHYILANKAEKGVGMYKVITYPSHTKDGVTTTFETPSFLNNAHRAWLPMPAAMSKSASSYVFAVWDRLTGVEENVFVDVVPEDTIYDLQGRRLKSITSSGIYIVNGKRVFVK